MGEVWGEGAKWYALTAYGHYKCPIRKGHIINVAHENAYGCVEREVEGRDGDGKGRNRRTHGVRTESGRSQDGIRCRSGGELREGGSGVELVGMRVNMGRISVRGAGGWAEGPYGMNSAQSGAVVEDGATATP